MKHIKGFLTTLGFVSSLVFLGHVIFTDTKKINDNTIPPNNKTELVTPNKKDLDKDFDSYLELDPTEKDSTKEKTQPKRIEANSK